jgi:hypothetical protein
MKRPDPFDLEHIMRYIHMDEMQIDQKYPFTGADHRVWGLLEQPNSHSRELVALRARKDIGTFSRKATARALSLLRKLGADKWKKVKPEYGTIAIDDESVFKFTFWVTSAIASILPVVSIVVLVRTQSLNGRLGIIAAFNVLTSICLTFFTDARRTDVFAVTAA